MIRKYRQIAKDGYETVTIATVLYDLSQVRSLGKPKN